MGAGRCEERQIVPKSARPGQGNLWPRGPRRARVARALARGRERDSPAPRPRRRDCRRARLGAARRAQAGAASARRAARATRPSSSSARQRRGRGRGAQPGPRDQRVDVGRVVARARASTARRGSASGVGPRGAGAAGAAAAAAGKRSSSRMSCAVSTSLAPSRISRWQPLENGEWIEPGIANTSRPCSAARRAVISEPERQRRLDDQHAAREAADQPVAPREVLLAAAACPARTRTASSPRSASACARSRFAAG